MKRKKPQRGRLKVERAGKASRSTPDAISPAPVEVEKRREFAARLLKWHEQHRRVFPWRLSTDPYRIAVAEALLQKTAAANAKPIYEEFIKAYPTVSALANASTAEVVQRLQPLGLPRRAHLLHEMARRVVAEYGGEYPAAEGELRSLPGIGPYGAAAIACMAFGQAAPMIDINVMRVFSRVFSTKYAPRSQPHKVLRAAVATAMPSDAAASYNLALLDFGALICRPVPRCPSCPLAALCDYYGSTQGPQS